MFLLRRCSVRTAPTLLSGKSFDSLSCRRRSFLIRGYVWVPMGITPTTHRRAADGTGAVQTVGAKKILRPYCPSVGVAPVHPVDTVDPIGTDGGDTNDIGGAVPVGEGI